MKLTIRCDECNHLNGAHANTCSHLTLDQAREKIEYYLHQGEIHYNQKRAACHLARTLEIKIMILKRENNTLRKKLQKAGIIK